MKSKSKPAKKLRRAAIISITTKPRRRQHSQRMQKRNAQRVHEEQDRLAQQDAVYRGVTVLTMAEENAINLLGQLAIAAVNIPTAMLHLAFGGDREVAAVAERIEERFATEAAKTDERMAA